MPTAFEERDGPPVAVTLNFGPGMECRSAVTAWDPPRMFAAQSEGWGGSPPIATEWSVEARAGGQSMVALNFYHYGARTAETVARETPLWQAWIRERFPMPLETSQSE